MIRNTRRWVPALGVVLAVAVSAAKAAEDFERRYSTLSQADKNYLARQRGVVESLARRHIGTPTRGNSMEDLRVIQELIDQGVLGPDRTFELQSLGVALGDLMAHKLDLHWIVFEDRYGRSRALRYRQTANLIFPTTMISKRVQKGVKVDVAELFEATRRRVERFAAPTGTPRSE